MQSLVHGGVGTRQRRLFLYVCHRSGLSCVCFLCRRGRSLADGYSSDSDAAVELWERRQLSTEKASEENQQAATKKATEAEEAAAEKAPTKKQRRRILRHVSSGQPTDIDSSSCANDSYL